jgi:hypothetical protein
VFWEGLLSFQKEIMVCIIILIPSVLIFLYMKLGRM